jgi:hypothetical protein
MNKKTAYQDTLSKAQSHLNKYERFLANILHNRLVYLVLDTLERSLFRIIPLQFALISSVTVGLLIIAQAYFYGYQIKSLSSLGAVFILGMIVGLIYEYVRTFIKQAK